MSEIRKLRTIVIQLALALLPAVVITMWVVTSRGLMGDPVPLPLSKLQIKLDRAMISPELVSATDGVVVLFCPLLVILNPWIKNVKSRPQRMLMYILGFVVWLVLTIWLVFSILAGVFGLAP